MSAEHRPAKKSVILTFVNCYLPGYKAGGPIRSIANLVAALGNEFEFRIVTSDRDRGDTRPYPHLDRPGEWVAVGRAKVLYLSPAKRGIRNLARIMRQTPHDVLYLNSFFDPDFTVKPLLARLTCLAPMSPAIIAPRGEFSTGALQVKAHKKAFFLTIAKLMGLYKGLRWQASSEHEADDVHRVMGLVTENAHIAMDVPVLDNHAAFSHVPRVEGDPLRVCFLSRISPMKNLGFALEVMRRVKTELRVDIYGPVADEAYWSACRAVMAALPPHVKAAYLGAVDHAKVLSVLARYDLFFLPTRGENFGHVIVEALLAGTPVLIANTTPWRDLAAAGVGWDLPLDRPEAFAEAIDLVAGLAPDALATMRCRSASYATARLSDRTIVEANRALFGVGCLKPA